MKAIEDTMKHKIEIPFLRLRLFIKGIFRERWTVKDNATRANNPDVGVRPHRIKKEIYRNR